MAKIEDLYFPISIPRWKLTGAEVAQINLFELPCVRLSLAMWRAKVRGKNEDFVDDPVRFIFGTLDFKTRYRYYIYPVNKNGTRLPIETSLYKLFVEPNREVLLKMANTVTKQSAKEYLIKRKRSVWKNNYQ